MEPCSGKGRGELVLVRGLLEGFRPGDAMLAGAALREGVRPAG